MPATYGVTAAALVIAVIAVAFGAQAPSLGVAEFAPAARQAVEAPPTTQGDEGGGPASRGGGRRQAATTTTVPPTASTAAELPDPSGPGTTRVDRSRPCFGPAPALRQLPDPRSPACVAAVFEGDNGGATSRGVSATEIRIGVPVDSGQTTKDAVTQFFEYMNRYFEFYGWRLVPVFVNTSGVSTNAAAQRALAADLAAQQIFALVDGPWGLAPSFFSEAARQGVVSIAHGAMQLFSDRVELDPLHPYLWSVYPSLDQTWQNLSDMACTALAGKVASHAGGTLASATRKFGLIVAGSLRMPNVRTLVEGLSACGITPLQAEVRPSSSTDARNAAETFKAAGVTTLICACVDGTGESMSYSMGAATGWEPEWLLPLFYARAPEFEQQLTNFSTAQRGRLFGLQPHARVLPKQAQWEYAARVEIDPKSAYVDFTDRLAVSYDVILLLAAGIQSAGPQLTPDTFGQGLMAAQFPNTEAGRAPYYSPSVGFGPGDHSFYNDFALAWAKQGADPEQPPANWGWCYLDGGARYSVGKFPANADSRFFNPSEPC